MTHRILILLLLLCMSASATCKHTTPSTPFIAQLDQVVSTASIPEQADARLDTLAMRLPASTQMAWMIGDLTVARSTMVELEPLISLTIEGKALMDELRDAHFDVLDASMWEEMGIPEHSAMTLAYIEDRVMWLALVEDKTRFDASFSRRLTHAFGGGAALTREEFEGHEVLTFSTSNGEHISWLHDGKLVIVALGSIGASESREARHGAQLQAIESLTHTTRDESCARSVAFTQWRQGISADSPMSGYINIEELAKNQAFRDHVSKDPDTEGAFKLIEANANTLGIALQRHSPKSFALSALFGGKPDINAQASALGVVKTPFPFGGMVNEDAIMGVRMTLNAEQSSNVLHEHMPPGDSQALEQVMESIRLALGLSEDITASITGQAALFLYKVDLGMALGIHNDSSRYGEALGIAMGVELEDQALVDALISSISAQPGVKSRSEAGALILDLPDKKGSFYVRPRSTVALGLKHAQVYYRTHALEEERMLAYITGDATRVEVLDAELSRPFASPGPHGGVYINAQKVGGFISMLIPESPSDQMFQLLDEIALTTEHTPAGPSVSLRITMRDAPHP